MSKCHIMSKSLANQVIFLYPVLNEQFSCFSYLWQGFGLYKMGNTNVFYRLSENNRKSLRKLGNTKEKKSERREKTISQMGQSQKYMEIYGKIR